MTDPIRNPQIDRDTRVEIDPDLHAAAEWMQANVPASRLVAVAGSLATLAPILWGQFKAEEIDAVRLVGLPISEPRIRAVSNG